MKGRASRGLGESMLSFVLELWVYGMCLVGAREIERGRLDVKFGVRANVTLIRAKRTNGFKGRQDVSVEVEILEQFQRDVDEVEFEPTVYPLDTAAVIPEERAMISMIGRARQRSRANAVKVMGSAQAEFLDSHRDFGILGQDKDQALASQAGRRQRVR